MEGDPVACGARCEIVFVEGTEFYVVVGRIIDGENLLR